MSDLAQDLAKARDRLGVSALRLLWSPAAICLAVAAACLVTLALPVSLPLGAMYWDLYVVVDGATRVLSGQVPSVDFFAPVGPLGYWLAAAGMRLSAHAQPLLLTQWSYFLVTLPPLLVVVMRIDRASRSLALTLLLPLLVFQLLPINVEQASSFPSVDGYGIYNRQAAQVLYPLVAALVFERRQRVLLFVIAWCCLALFLSKITGFVTAGLLCAFAFAAGRIRLATAVGALAVSASSLALLDHSTGLVRAYVADIATLVVMNEGGLAGRFLQAASIHFGIFGSGLALLLALAWMDRHAALGLAGGLARRPSLASLHALLDRNAVWLAVALLAGLFFETQNTGGQAFLFVWPVLLQILLSAGRYADRGTIAVFALVAATALPPAVNVVHKGVRAMVGQMRYERLALPDLKTLSQVSQRREVMHASQSLIARYASYPQTYQAFADAGQLPTFSLYGELDFQMVWLLAAGEAVEAVRSFETQNAVRFETVLNLNFVNPFPYLLDREGPRHVAIGADPFRAVPPLDEDTRAAVAATDLVLWPRCPITAANRDLLRIYEPALAGHRLVTLSPCWQAFVRAGLLPAN